LMKFLKLTTKKNKIFQDWGGVTPPTPPHRDTPDHYLNRDYSHRWIHELLDHYLCDKNKQRRSINLWSLIEIKNNLSNYWIKYNIRCK
jgi:hypothetical protein